MISWLLGILRVIVHFATRLFPFIGRGFAFLGSWGASISRFLDNSRFLNGILQALTVAALFQFLIYTAFRLLSDWVGGWMWDVSLVNRLVPQGSGWFYSLWDHGLCLYIVFQEAVFSFDFWLSCIAGEFIARRSYLLIFSAKLRFPGSRV